MNDASGYVHWKTDLWTVHSYRATPKEQKDFLLPRKGDRRIASNTPAAEPPYEGQPFLLDEWGDHPVDDLNAKRWNKLGIETNYYTTNLHKGCFALPAYVEKLLAKVE